MVLSPKHFLPFLQPGTFTAFLAANFSIDENVTWGIIINFEKVKSHGEGTQVKTVISFQSIPLI